MNAGLNTDMFGRRFHVVGVLPYGHFVDVGGLDWLGEEWVVCGWSHDHHQQYLMVAKVGRDGGVRLDRALDHGCSVKCWSVIDDLPGREELVLLDVNREAYVYDIRNGYVGRRCPSWPCPSVVLFDKRFRLEICEGYVAYGSSDRLEVYDRRSGALARLITGEIRAWSLSIFGLLAYVVDDGPVTIVRPGDGLEVIIPAESTRCPSTTGAIDRLQFFLGELLAARSYNAEASLFMINPARGEVERILPGGQFVTQICEARLVACFVLRGSDDKERQRVNDLRFGSWAEGVDLAGASSCGAKIAALSPLSTFVALVGEDGLLKVAPTRQLFGFSERPRYLRIQGLGRSPKM